MRWLAVLPFLVSAAPVGAQGDDLTEAFESMYARISERAGPCVVSILVDREKEEPKRSTGPMGSMMDGGVFKNRPARAPVSGTIVDPDGWILTSHFNVSGKIKGIEVTLADGRVCEGKLKGVNATFDLAIVKIDAKDLPTISKAPLKDLKTGRFVAALGRAPDRRHLTLNQGIVSAPWRLSGRGIQIDARLNYGNAGGPVVDRDGRLVGIACKVDTKFSGSYGQNSGVGFAITWDKIEEILPDLKNGKIVGEPRRPFLGIQANVESEVEGVEVQVVQPASAAEKAGMKNGDIIVEFDGKKVKNFDELRAIIGSKAPGDKVKIKVRRGSEEHNLEAELGWAPGE